MTLRALAVASQTAQRSGWGLVLLATCIGAVSATEDPSRRCVPTHHGCLALNPDVTVQTIGSTICKPGYTKSVRPLSRYTNGVKHKLMRENGLAARRSSEFELDHIVPLSLGGHPRHLSNLMLQEWEGPAGAKVKDKLEVRLHGLVCRGKMTLDAAQSCIAEDWQKCLAEHPGKGAVGTHTRYR